ncbi:amidohydrolase family protein [Neolewinella litorea]|uniref:Amidohydrolase n=1 Tax=Neolewinella litorea TaxID=2562452 RepID=A0A4S4N718_9BACT|nr:amidohydrolase family protein [Neolewinella litorea]THH34946.1 amidohydrolase [Neolewinella litorea]
MKVLFAHLLSALLLAHCTRVAPPETSDASNELVIYDVNVLTMLDDRVLPDRAVVVADGRISRVVPMDQVDTADFAEVIDGRGQYLLPGLAEMHAHIPHPDEAGDDRIEETLFLYLANGITTVRGMLGHPAHLELRRAVAEGSVLGPRIFTSGPSLNGNTVQTPEEARTKVRAQQEAGYDFLKIHPGIQREVFDTLVATANAVGIDFAGHVPVDVGIRHALSLQYASIDHVDGYLEGLVPESAGVNPAENGFFGYNFAPLIDLDLLPELIRLTEENRVWVVTTESLFTRWASPEPAEVYLRDPEMKYMPGRTLLSWRQNKTNLITAPGYTREQWEQMMATRREIIRRLNETGLLLLGSDAPQVFNVPGFSIHHEIDALQAAGLSAYDILRMGTVHPAQYFDRAGEFGTVEPGASADLMLVSGNPLEDMDHLQHPAGVMIRGRWLDQDFLEAGLEGIAVGVGE